MRYGHHLEAAKNKVDARRVMTLGNVFILLIETRLKLEREYAKPDRNEQEIALLNTSSS